MLPRRALLLLAGVTLAASACGSAASPPLTSSSSTAAASGSITADFADRAEQIAAGLRAEGALTAYRKELVVSGERVRWGGFSDERAKEAAAAGRAVLALPDLPAPGPATISFGPHGSRTVALIPAATAAALAITQPCGPTERCALSLDAAKLVQVMVETNQGRVEVPFWEFTGGGLSEPLRVLAIDSADATGWQPPTLPPLPSDRLGDRLVGVFGPAAIEGTSIRYAVGTGACDTEPRGLVHETEDVVILGGSVTPPAATQMYTAQLIATPVSVTLAAHLGARPLVDAATGELIARR